MTPAPLKLLTRVTCPHCWTGFAPEDILWISTHADLRGDPRLGLDHHQRFLPTRFTPEGDALDAKGFPCVNLACPYCHLGVPRAMLEMEPFFVSILGAPSCGKSYYLAALIWELRRILPGSFGLSFGDADPVSNLILSEYEKALFLNGNADQPVPLGQLIRKTELQGDLYDTVAFGNQTVSYPRPFLFWLRPNECHPNMTSPSALSRVLVLYDNAGEHCLPGRAYAEQQPLQQLLKEHRRLALMRAPIRDRLLHLRKLQGLDAVNNVWAEEARAYEQVRLRQLDAEIDNALTGMKPAAVARVWAELQETPWTGGPPQQQIQRLRLAFLRQIAGELRAAIHGPTPEKAINARAKWQQLHPEAILPASDPLWGSVRHDLEVLAKYEDRKLKELEFQTDLAHLEEAMRVGANTERHRELWNAVTNHRRAIPRKVEERYYSLVTERNEKRNSRDRIVVAVVFAVGMIAMLIFLGWLLFRK